MSTECIKKDGQGRRSACHPTCVMAAAAGPSFTVFCLLPAHIFLMNKGEFYTSAAALFLLFAASAFLVFLMLTGILFALGPTARRAAVAACATLALAVWMQGYVFNWNYGPLDGSYWVFQFLDIRALDSVAWLLLALFVFGVGFLKGRSFRAPLLIVLLIQAASVLYIFHAARVGETDEETTGISRKHQFSFSKENNIIMLVLDAFQSDVFNAYLESNPEYKAQLPGFSYYPDALATTYLTARSLPAILTGQVYEGKSTFSEYLTDANNNHLIHRHLRQAGYYVGVYNFFSGARGYYHPAAFSGIADNYAEDSGFFDPVTAREFSRIMAITLFRAAPHLAKQEIYNRWVLDLSVEQDRDVFARGMQKHGQVAASQPRFNYYHLQGLHQPHVVDGTYLNWEDPKSSMLVAAALCDMMADFVRKLQELQVYDNAAIIIVADHGLLWNPEDIRYGQFAPPETNATRSPGVFAKKLRALPLVLFKPPHAAGPLRVSERAVSLVDIAPTLRDAAGINQDHTSETGAGRSLLRDPVQPRVRRFFSSEFLRQPYYEYAVSGFAWHDASWNYTGNVYYDGHIEREVLYNYQPGTTLSFGDAGTGIQYLDGHWETQQAVHAMASPEASITLPLERWGDTMTLALDVSRFPEDHASTPLAVLVAVNDTPPEHYTLDNNARFEIRVTGNMVTAGEKPSIQEAPLTVPWLAPVPRPAHTQMTIRFEIAGETAEMKRSDGQHGHTLALNALTLFDH